MTKNAWHLLLLGVGAIVLLVYLMRRGAPAAQIAQDTGISDLSAPSYPNAEPIQMGNIEVGGSPVNLTYNLVPGGSLLPDVAVGLTPDACACNDPCKAVRTLTSVSHVPAPVLSAAQSNFASAVAKAPSITFGSAPARPSSNDGGAVNI